MARSEPNTNTHPGPLPVMAKLPSQPMGILESYRAARRNVLEIIPLRALHQPVISGATGPQRWHMVMDPAAVRRVLLEAVEAYPKSNATKDILRPAIGESLFIAEGEHWRWQRRAAAPAFSARQVKALSPVMTRAAEAAVARMEHLAGRAADMVADMTAATFDVIADVTFSDAGAINRDGVQTALEHYIDSAARVSLLDVLGAPSWIPRPGRTAAANDLAEMQASADAAIARRQAGGKAPGESLDLLDLLLGATDPESGREMRPEELRENLLTFIVAGHETTALTLSWALYLLAFDPAAQERAREEAQAVIGTGPATADHVPDLSFTRAVIEETLRLYPPGGLLSRTAQEADRLSAAVIRPGDTVMIPVYGLHRHRKLWDAPDAFVPERWLEGTRPDRYQYLPFGDGPRICIGAQFALQEAVIILASLLARFQFEGVRGKEPYPEMILTLRPKGGVWLEVKEAAKG